MSLQLQVDLMALDLQVSLDGRNFASGLFPPSMRPNNHVRLTVISFITVLMI